MERLTKNEDVLKMSMYELAHNSCYIVEDGSVRYRDFDTDIDARTFVRNLMTKYGHWKSCEEYGPDADNELIDDDIFDDTMLENLMYDPEDSIGLIALFYRNLWVMAELRERLKAYEDAEEQGLLLRLPCKIGDTVYRIVRVYQPCTKHHCTFDVSRCRHCKYECDSYKGKQIVEERINRLEEIVSSLNYFSKTIFLTKEEAEQALKDMESEG